MATTNFPPRDQAYTNLVVQNGLVAKNLTLGGTLAVKKLDVLPSVFSTVSAVNVTSGSFQTSGGYFGNLVSLQVAFSLDVAVPLNTGVQIATLDAAQAPLGNITGVALTSTFEGHTLLLDSTGTLFLYATSFAIPPPPVFPVPKIQVTGSLTYLV